ncbi:DNA-directed RNA polymerase subunit omega [Anaerosphaera multitolerans]|uniref:DNA-directed RNA polymerase subunit omega n=1 Tax=Anaerosphaera multitolerans TaxID=2487351 RepID=A0A437S7B5_9FIRM|nr:DNA-directed RNA polymerase subunit omega [Anaerosphaera multitolerans]
MIIPSFSEIKDVTNSRYELVILTAKRARKIVDGAKPLIETDSTNPVTISIEEILDKSIVFGEPMSDREYAKKIEEEKNSKYEIIRERELRELESRTELEDDFIGSDGENA